MEFVMSFVRGGNVEDILVICCLNINSFSSLKSSNGDRRANGSGQFATLIRNGANFERIR